jgi:3',5'-cyclic-AMP phosphodiesterase
MDNIIWVTDPHFNFLRFNEAVQAFGEYITSKYPDAEAMILTGDISESWGLFNHLKRLSEGFGRPVYFILGNHDYYGSNFMKVDQYAKEVCADCENCIWVRESGPIDLGNDTILVGTGGWYDARYSGRINSLRMADFELIEDLRAGQNLPELIVEFSRKKADELALELKLQLEKVTEPKRILVATHVAPYDRAAWYEGKMSEPAFLPWFSDYATGQVLDEFIEANPNTNVVVLCGHCHSPGVYERVKNCTVYTGKAKYGAPDVAGKINLLDFRVEMQGSNIPIIRFSDTDSGE